MALAAGEPIGPARARQAVAREFGAYCRAHGWLPAFYQVADIDINAYRTAGLRTLKIGEEAIATCNVLGALGMLRCLDVGCKLLALGALGIFIQAIWGHSAGYLGGWIGWGLAIGLAPIEAWVIWFLRQPEARAHLQAARQGADERRRRVFTLGNTV